MHQDKEYLLHVSDKGQVSRIYIQKLSKVNNKKKNQFFLFLKFYLFILFMAVLGLRFCARAFSSCGKRGPLFIAVRGPLTVAASPVAEHRLQTHRLSSCGSWAQLLRGMWDPPRPGLEPVSPALAGRLSTTAPPGKPPNPIFILFVCLFLAALDLHCCAQAFSICSERGLLFVGVGGLLIAVAFLVVEHGL